MIDFRYHLVSLISVFIALAVGIALGAGPLKETIGDTLTGQVSQLREEKDAMRVELDAAQAAVADNERYLEEVAGSLLDGALAERRIAFVMLDDVPDGELADLEASFVAAGASVPTRVTLTERWTSEEGQVFRSALAARLVEYLEPGIDLSASADEILAAALTQSIAGKDPANPVARSANAEILGGLLSAEDGALVEAELSDGGPVDAVVVISRPEVPAAAGTEEESSASPDQEAEARALEARLRTQAAVVLAAQQRSDGAILAADEYVDGGLVSFVRGSEEYAERLSTVTRFTTMSGRLSTVLGLGSRLALRVGHYGFDPGADAAAAPRVELPPVDRTPVFLPEAPDSQDPDGDGTGDDEGTDTDSGGDSAAGDEQSDDADGGTG
ncbi:MAG: copper transporter [Actinomycetota bacterium]|nr:copper transporter [Actinomycetota bacterium]